MGEKRVHCLHRGKGHGVYLAAALGAVFVAGVLFTVLTVLKVRSWLAEALPISLKFSFAVGIGLFLAFIGLNETGIVRLGVPGAPVSWGTWRRPGCCWRCSVSS